MLAPDMQGQPQTSRVPARPSLLQDWREGAGRSGFGGRGAAQAYRGATAAAGSTKGEQPKQKQPGRLVPSGAQLVLRGNCKPALTPFADRPPICHPDCQSGFGDSATICAALHLGCLPSLLQWRCCLGREIGRISRLAWA